MQFYQVLSFPAGAIRIEEKDGKIVRIRFLDDKTPPFEGEEKKTPLLADALSQFSAYFAGRLKKFDLPFILSGTPFQMKVWEALQTIPYGKTCSYKELAEKAGSPKAARPAGMANNRNPLPLIIPCHRVIGSDGSLTGFAGGLDVKQFLLTLEKRNA